MNTKTLVQEMLTMAKDVGEIKGIVQQIDKTLNGQIEDMKKHINESNRYRPKIETNFRMIKFYKWVFGVVFTMIAWLGWVIIK